MCLYNMCVQEIRPQPRGFLRPHSSCSAQRLLPCWLFSGRARGMEAGVVVPPSRDCHLPFPRGQSQLARCAAMSLRVCVLFPSSC